jgi:hypothetical protein
MRRIVEFFSRLVKAGALNAQHRQGVDVQPLGVDQFTTLVAITVFTGIYPCNGNINHRQSYAGPTAGLFGHGLGLQRVHAGQSPHPGLIQFHGGTRLTAPGEFFPELLAQVLKSLT